MAANSSYLLDNAEAIAERRMRALSVLFDPDTKRTLVSVGISPGWHCLEVGGGGGSAARWMAEQVSPLGTVLCTDIDPRLIPAVGMANMHVMRHDAARDAFPESQFDLAHARLVLLHIPDRDRVLEKMVAALKPGGWLVVEDFDTTAVLPDPSANSREDRLETAESMRAFMIRGGVDPRYGRKLYGRFKSLGLTAISSEGRLRMWDSSNGGAELMRINFAQIGPKALASGLLGDGQLRADLARLDDPSFVTPSPIMWTTIGQKPSEPVTG